MELLIDGHTSFLFLDKDGKPKVAMHLEHVMKRIVDRYNDTHEDKLPSITPHVLRHTFCTEMANSGIDLKSLQYLMGHSDAGVTLNVYTLDYSDTETQTESAAYLTMAGTTKLAADVQAASALFSCSGTRRA